MYLIINNSLQMKKGKIASQVSHVACRITRHLERLHERPKYYDYWLDNGEAKIVLKSSEKLLLHLIDKYSNKNKRLWCYYIRDDGRTQVKHNSLTCVGFCPIDKENIPNEIKSLKLL